MFLPRSLRQTAQCSRPPLRSRACRSAPQSSSASSNHRLVVGAWAQPSLPASRCCLKVSLRHGTARSSRRRRSEAGVSSSVRSSVATRVRVRQKTGCQGPLRHTSEAAKRPPDGHAARRSATERFVTEAIHWVGDRRGSCRARPGSDSLKPTRGFEPRTPALRERCSGHLSYVGIGAARHRIAEAAVVPLTGRCPGKHGSRSSLDTPTPHIIGGEERGRSTRLSIAGCCGLLRLRACGPVNRTGLEGLSK